MSADYGIAEAMAKISAAESMALALGDTTHITVDLASFEEQKLEWLRTGGRDFFDVSPRMTDAVAKAMSDFIARQFVEYGSAPTVFEIYYVGTEAFRAVVLSRFSDQGGGMIGDVPAVSLSRGWLTYKRRHGFSAYIGLFKGDLFRALKTAPIRFVR